MPGADLQRVISRARRRWLKRRRWTPDRKSFPDRSGARAPDFRCSQANENAGFFLFWRERHRANGGFVVPAENLWHVAGARFLHRPRLYAPQPLKGGGAGENFEVREFALRGRDEARPRRAMR